MMQQKDVHQFQKPTSLAEIMQKNKTQFALCRWDKDKDMVVQCHQFVHCRDFMIDAIVSAESGRDISIYGFKFNKDNPRIDFSATSMLLRFPDQGTLKAFQDNFHILKGIEEVLGFSPSYAELVNFPDQPHQAVVWLLGDKAWQHNAVAFSLYGYLIKCMSYRPFTKDEDWMSVIKTEFTSTPEGSYMNMPWVQWLLSGGVNTISELYPNFSGWKNQKDIASYTLHDNSGFVSVGQAVWKNKAKIDNHVLNGYKAAA